jgi:outer membrane biosynthesis protein TonB
MLSKRQLVVGLLVPLLAFQLACHKKQTAQKPKLPGPAEAPTLTQTLPYEIQPEPVPEPPAQTAKVEEPQAKPKSKSHSRSSTKKPPTDQTGTQAKAEVTPPPSPPASDTTTAGIHPPPNPAEAAAAVAIGPDVSSAEAARDRKSTTALLDTTEKDLKRVDSKGLSSDQQAMLMQIRTYISQSRKAINEGDYERASNLAKKAQLLTDELLK